MNLRVALSHEDLGYASYVKEYNNGRFNAARRHAETALQIMERYAREHDISIIMTVYWTKLCWASGCCLVNIC